MSIACVTAIGPGATDRLLSEVAARLAGDGLRVLGALRATDAGSATSCCDSDLWILPDGPLARITQDLGPGSAACRMDAGAMQQAVGLASTRLASGGADLVILNKFGLSEAEGRGFRSLIGEAISLGIPVLTGLSDTHRAAFHQFAEGLADVLQPEVEAIIGWYRRTSTGATSTQEGATVA